MPTATAKGSKSLLTFRQETTLGVAATGNYNGLSFSSETLDVTIAKIISGEIRPDRTVPAIRGGNKASGGAFTTDFAIVRHVQLLRHLLGGTAYTTTTLTPPAFAGATVYARGAYVTSNTGRYVCVVGGTSGAIGAGLITTDFSYETHGTTVWQWVALTATPLYQHELTAATDLPSVGLTFEKGIVGGSQNLYQRFVGGRINTLDLTIPQEGIVQSAFEVLFLGVEQRTLTSNSGTVATFNDEPTTGYETAIILAGTENYDMREGSLRITNNMDAGLYAIGSRNRRDIVEDRREISASLTAYFTDQALYARFENETAFAMILSMITKGQTCRIDIPEVKFFGSPIPKVGGPGVITSSFDVSAFKQSAAYDLRLTITSTKTTTDLGF